MALNIKNSEVEKLATEVASIAGETKTEAIRRALLERRERLVLHVVPDDRHGELVRFLDREVWPAVPKSELGRRMSPEEAAVLLGYGPEGV